jgi:UDP-N-acetylmuramyl-tripeptide synthetase
MDMRVSHILNTLKAQGVQVRSLTADSRALTIGDVFLAYPGELSDGRRYIAAALARGAAAVVYEAKDATVTVPSADVPHLAVENLRAVVAALAAEVYGHPSQQLWMAAVTGTNGKTSVTQWLAECFKQIGKRCALVGTLGNGYPGALTPSPNTTPNALTLQRALQGFVADGADACAIEVSSIGIEEGRVDATQFAVAVFTNLTRDHLDYHGSMEAYAAAKMRLFNWPGLQAAVINLDDPFGVQIAAQLKGKVFCIGYTLNNAQADVDECLSAQELKLEVDGLSFAVSGVPVQSAAIGRFNAANLLAVMGALRAYGCSLQEAAASCATLGSPPGRMQTLGGKDAPLVVVDYAHTPDALEKVLLTLREIASARGGRLHCVFGCGGERDAGKRPLMGAVAEQHADTVMLTSDNPRAESAQAIINEIRAGMKKVARVEPSRSAAIRAVIGEAAVSDVVLVAGKGHEDYQEINGIRQAFSDSIEAAEALEQRP